MDPEATTSAAQSTITPISLSYIAGDIIAFDIIAKDSYGNLRPLSVAETFVATLTEDTSATAIPLTPVSNNDGTYSVSHQITAADSHTLTVTFGGTNLLSTPVTLIAVSVGVV